jgi:hypothetical protein
MSTWLGARHPRLLGLLATLGALATPVAAHALPRFAARTGMDCRQCHVSASGGGVRTRYGSAVFQQLLLPASLGDALGAGELGLPSPQLTDWLTVGTDVRTAYLYSAPQRGRTPDEAPATQSSFFLMQADLYTAAALGPHVRVVLDVGVYSGFEAWAQLRARAEPSDVDVWLKVGRFLPAFGVRDANHDLYTRKSVGFDAADRDTGVELTGFLGPLTLAVALVNGTVGDTLFDGYGAAERSFEKALVGRASLRLSGEHLHVTLGGSVYLNDNAESATPLFVPALDPAVDTSNGVDGLRLGGHLMLGLGRLSYVGEVVYVRDDFVEAPVTHAEGYAMAHELGVRLWQGVELLGSVELLDPDLSATGDVTLRGGGAVELYFGPYFEVRTMVRYALSDLAPTGDVTDVVVQAHVAY